MRSESRQRLLREKSHKQHSNKCDEGRNWAQWAQFPYWIVWLLGWKIDAQERANFGGTSRATYVSHGQQTAVCFGNWPNQLNQTNPHRYRRLVLFWKALNRNLCCRRLFFQSPSGRLFVCSWPQPQLTPLNMPSQIGFSILCSFAEEKRKYPPKNWWPDSFEWHEKTRVQLNFDKMNGNELSHYPTMTRVWWAACFRLAEQKNTHTNTHW